MSPHAEGALHCLWMDLKTSIQIKETPPHFAQRCHVLKVCGLDEAAIAREHPDFVVLEFDYPGRPDLDRALMFKHKFSHVPMIVATVQHSEQLAVWFYRAKFYDYLVQPLPRDEVMDCIARIEAIKQVQDNQRHRPLAQARMTIPNEVSVHGSTRVRLQPALTLIERNYHQRLLVTEAAEHCGMPAFRFGREFKEQFGMEFREYLLRYRIREACRLLSNPSASITEVGYSVGFSEPSYFTKMFKKLVGRCPSDMLGIEDFELETLDASPEWAVSRNYQHPSAKS